MSRTRARKSSSRSASIQRTVRIAAITYLFLIGRLKDGTTLAAAKAELETLLAAWPSSVSRPASNANGPHTPDPQRHRLRFDPLQDQIVGGAKTAVLVLQGAVVLVLLIACANIANLLLARAEARHKEFAVRAAIGAGARQLIAPFVAEGVILTAVGTGLGLWSEYSACGRFSSRFQTACRDRAPSRSIFACSPSR